MLGGNNAQVLIFQLKKTSISVLHFHILQAGSWKDLFSFAAYNRYGQSNWKMLSISIQSIRSEHETETSVQLTKLMSGLAITNSYLCTKGLYTVCSSGGKLSLEAYANWLTHHPPSVSLDTRYSFILVSFTAEPPSFRAGDDHVSQPGSAVSAVQSHTHTHKERHGCESTLNSIQNWISRCGEMWTIYPLARVQLVRRVQYKASHQRWCLFTDNRQNSLPSLSGLKENIWSRAYLSH